MQNQCFFEKLPFKMWSDSNFTEGLLPIRKEKGNINSDTHLGADTHAQTNTAARGYQFTTVLHTRIPWFLAEAGLVAYNNNQS